MSNKKAVVKIGADVEEAKKGIDSISSQLNTLSNNVQRSSFSKFTQSVSNFGNAFKFATDAIKKVNESIKENIELSRKQQQAETQLAAAAKNNPYLTEASVIQLKKYAGELQSISTIGDEELLPMMANLAAAGRTQEEIQNIMSAALDVSASGTMSFESAVKNLNKTFSGLSGELGESVPAIKNLTKEELQNGKAVEVLANQYKGISETVSEQTGGWQKYKNSLGDFKEVLGSGWADLQNSVGHVLSGFFDTITSKLKVAKEKAEEFKASLNLIAENNSDNATTATIQSEIDLLTKQNEKYEQYQKALTTSKKDFVAGEKEKLKALQETYDALQEQMIQYIESNTKGVLTGEESAMAGAMAESKYLEEQFLKMHPEMLQLETDIKNQEKAVKTAGKEYNKLNEEATTLMYTSSILSERIDDNKKRLEELTPKLKEATNAAKAQAEADEADAKAKEAQKKAEDEAAEKLKTRNKLREEYNKSLEKTQSQIQARRQLGETITEEEEAQLMLNSATQAYINMYSDPAFDRSQTKSGMWAGEAEQISQIQKFASKAGKEAEDAFKDLRNAIAEVNNEVIDSTLKNLQKQMDSLDTYADGLDEQSELYQQYLEAKEALARQYADREAEIERESAETAKQAMNERFNEVSTIADKMNEVVSGITANIRKQNEEQTQEELTSLSEQYTDGEISYEEFCERKKEINRKAAQEEYKLKMWEWQSSMLQASASIAQGIAASLSQGMPVGAIMAALSAAAGAIQIAAIMQNKPKPPSFATGGVVGGIDGASMGADNTIAHVRSGEMILNAAQQRSLWEMANGGNAGNGAVVNMPVTIENRNGSSVQTQLNEKGLRIIVDDMVNTSMQQGRFQKSMEVSQSKANGVSYL